ncbi:MAG: hypothetical protein ACTSR0_04045 [Candidatus Asgardarchaeia archaeon]
MKLKDYALAVVLAEELGRVIGEKEKVVKVEGLNWKATRSKIDIKTDVQIPTTFLNIKGEGYLKELRIKSTHTNFGVRIIIEKNITLYDKPYSWFYTNSQEIESVQAYQRTINSTNYYILSLLDIHFTKSLKIVFFIPSNISTSEVKTIEEVYYNVVMKEV